MDARHALRSTSGRATPSFLRVNKNRPNNRLVLGRVDNNWVNERNCGLVPRLCLGTHCPGGSASRGWVTRGRASPTSRFPRQSLGTRFSGLRELPGYCPHALVLLQALLTG